MESVVLPNMDDIAFFNSLTREHRGGIWADSQRQPQDPEQDAEPTDETEEPTPILNASAPSLVKSDSDATISGIDSATRSTPSLVQTSNNGRSKSSPPEHIDLPTPTSSTTSLPQKRRTWLAGTDAAPYTDSPSLEPSPRGRVTETEPNSAGRSQSTPRSARPGDTFALSEQTPTLDTTHLTPSLSRRSSSHGSRTSVHPDSDTDVSNALDNYDSAQLSTSAPSTPSLTRTASSSSSRASAGATSTAASQASSFLSTLKAKAAAADKQAIGIQAKEAMRKWGASWARLRKDSVGEHDGADAPDAGEREPLRAPTPGGPSRATFADMRAKVEERKASRTGDSPRETSPIPIPGSERARSISGGHEMAVPADDRPSAPSPSSSPAPPRHTQPPRPKTMSIPGIHVSHRGDVMSMGYTPPVAALPPNDPASKTSVYSRLWKASAANQAEGAGGPGVPNSSGANDPFLDPSHDDSATAAPLPSVAVSESDSPPKAMAASGVPPPLPPRNAPRLSAPDSPASAALALIRSRDEGVRAATPDARTPAQAAPPLPPRKAKVPTEA
jgi:hypothetical protein